MIMISLQEDLRNIQKESEGILEVAMLLAAQRTLKRSIELLEAELRSLYECDLKSKTN